jgi:CAAX protease family protein
MKSQRDLLPWATLLYVVTVLASLPLTTRGGGGPPPLGLDPALLTIIAQVGTILLPTLIFLALARRPAQELLNLRGLDVVSGVKSFLAGLLCWPMFTCLSTLVLALIGLLHPTTPADAAGPAGPSGSPWLIFLGVVLVAPLVEELLFRGVLLSTFQESLGAHAIWLVGILFGFLHPSFSQALGAVFVGIVAGWLVYRTRSLWAGVLAHLGVNLVGGVMVLLTSLAAPGALEEAAQAENAGSMVWIGALVWAAIGLIMLVPVFFLLRSIARRHPAPEAGGGGLSLKALWAPAAATIGVVGFALYDLLQAA